MANSPNVVYVLVIEGRDFKDIKKVTESLRVAKDWEARNIDSTDFEGIYGYYQVQVEYEDN